LDQGGARRGRYAKSLCRDLTARPGFPLGCTSARRCSQSSSARSESPVSSSGAERGEGLRTAVPISSYTRHSLSRLRAGGWDRGRGGRGVRAVQAECHRIPGHGPSPGRKGTPHALCLNPRSAAAVAAIRCHPDRPRASKEEGRMREHVIATAARRGLSHWTDGDLDLGPTSVKVISL